MNVRRCLATLTIGALVAAGCGAAAKLAPQVAVREAAQATGAQGSSTFTVSLDGSDDDLNALFNDGKPITAEDRKGFDLLRRSRLTITSAGGRSAFNLRVGDVADALALRFVDKKIYARADVSGLTDLFGLSRSEVNQAVSGAQLGNFPQAFTHLALINAVSHVIADEQKGEREEASAVFTEMRAAGAAG